MTVTTNQSGAPNYYPNSFSGPECNPKVALSASKVSLVVVVVVVVVVITVVLGYGTRRGSLQHRQRGQLHSDRDILQRGVETGREEETGRKHRWTPQERGPVHPEESSWEFQASRH